MNPRVLADRRASENFHQRFSRPIAAAMVSYDGLHWPVLEEIDPGLA